MLKPIKILEDMEKIGWRENQRLQESTENENNERQKEIIDTIGKQQTIMEEYIIKMMNQSQYRQDERKKIRRFI
jgi:hypothetical protein